MAIIIVYIGLHNDLSVGSGDNSSRCSCTDFGRISLSQSQRAGMASNPVLVQLSLVFITILSADGMPSPPTSGIVSMDIDFYFCLLELSFSIT